MDMLCIAGGLQLRFLLFSGLKAAVNTVQANRVIDTAYSQVLSVLKIANTGTICSHTGNTCLIIRLDLNTGMDEQY
jgi:hypothetical protein